MSWSLAHQPIAPTVIVARPLVGTTSHLHRHGTGAASYYEIATNLTLLGDRAIARQMKYREQERPSSHAQGAMLPLHRPAAQLLLHPSDHVP